MFLSRQDRVLPGEKRVVQIPTPAAGADWSVTVPGGRQWRISAGRAIFTTSAVVASRIPRLTLSDGTTIYWENSVQATMVASNVYRLGFSAGGAQQSTGNANVDSALTLPDLWLPGGHQFMTQTTAIDVGDQWSGLALFISEYWFDDQYLSQCEAERHARHQEQHAQPHDHPGVL